MCVPKDSIILSSVQLFTDIKPVVFLKSFCLFVLQPFSMPNFLLWWIFVKLKQGKGPATIIYSIQGCDLLFFT